MPWAPLTPHSLRRDEVHKTHYTTPTFKGRRSLVPVKKILPKLCFVVESCQAAGAGTRTGRVAGRVCREVSAEQHAPEARHSEVFSGTRREVRRGVSLPTQSLCGTEAAAADMLRGGGDSRRRQAGGCRQRLANSTL